MNWKRPKLNKDDLKRQKISPYDAKKIGNPRADVLGAAILVPWDFPPKVPVLFFMFLGKGGAWSRGMFR